MTLFRYKAVALRGAESGRQSGEISGDDPAAARAALRQRGLQVLEIRPAVPSSLSIPNLCTGWINNHLRRRRRLERAELFDGLSTLLESGLPLLESLDTMRKARADQRASMRSMILRLREDVRSGRSFGQALSAQESWFHPLEVAMVEAGQHAGTLPDVLRTLVERHQRSNGIAQKVIGSLAYPLLVLCVGFGVLLFLSNHTLPDLAAILSDSRIEVPRLTRGVMSIGQGIATNWLALTGTLSILSAIVILVRVSAGKHQRELPSWLIRLQPSLSRRLAVARVAVGLTELSRAGVPLVEALRVLAPTVGSLTLRRRLDQAATRVERGEELSQALDDEAWFDAEFRRLLDVGQESGELDRLLEKLGARHERKALRTIDRMATLLEPMSLLILAALIGVLVMAAILPILRLQEIL